MAASTIPAPGSTFGPCPDDCQHRDCRTSRSDAAESCRFCGDVIGYDTRFYWDPLFHTGQGGRFVHAACLEDAEQIAARPDADVVPVRVTRGQ